MKFTNPQSMSTDVVVAVSLPVGAGVHEHASIEEVARQAFTDVALRFGMTAHENDRLRTFEVGSSGKNNNHAATRTRTSQWHAEERLLHEIVAKSHAGVPKKVTAPSQRSAKTENKVTRAVAQTLIVRHYGPNSTEYLFLKLTWHLPRIRFARRFLNKLLNQTVSSDTLHQSMHLNNVGRFNMEWRACLMQRGFDVSLLDPRQRAWTHAEAMALKLSANGATTSSQALDISNSSINNHSNESSNDTETLVIASILRNERRYLGYEPSDDVHAVTFASPSQLVRVIEFSVVTVEREGRLARGKSATDVFNRQRPLRNLRSGELVHLHDEGTKKPRLQRAKSSPPKLPLQFQVAQAAA